MAEFRRVVVVLGAGNTVSEMTDFVGFVFILVLMVGLAKEGSEFSAYRCCWIGVVGFLCIGPAGAKDWVWVCLVLGWCTVLKGRWKISLRGSDVEENARRVKLSRSRQI